MSHEFDADAALERIREARAALEPTDPDQPPPEPETYDQIKHRMFEGGDLADTADRMFRN